MSIVAKDCPEIYQNPPPGIQYHISSTANPTEKIKWYNAIMEASGGDAKFSNGMMDNLMTAIAWLNGTPTCEGHLWEYYANPRRR